MTDSNAQNDAMLRSIIESVYDQLGEKADPDTVKDAVKKTLEEIERSRAESSSGNDYVARNPQDSGRVIVTAFGLNRPGMVSGISEVLARYKCNIENISQRILQEFFALILIVDISECPISLRELKNELGETGNKLGIRVMAQHEDVFNYMHRL